MRKSTREWRFLQRENPSHSTAGTVPYARILCFVLHNQSSGQINVNSFTTGTLLFKITVFRVKFLVVFLSLSHQTANSVLQAGNTGLYHPPPSSPRASQAAQWLSTHLPAQETQDRRVRSLGWEDPLEEEIATHSSILAWEIPRTEESGGPCICHGVTKSQTWLSNWACTHAPSSLLYVQYLAVKSGCSFKCKPRVALGQTMAFRETRPHVLRSLLIPLLLFLFQNAHPSFFLGLKANAVGPVCNASPEFSSSSTFPLALEGNAQHPTVRGCEHILALTQERMDEANSLLLKGCKLG